MAIHTLDNVRCTLAKNDLGYGILRCDSSGILVCPVGSSSSQYSSFESEISSLEVSSEEIISREQSQVSALESSSPESSSQFSSEEFVSSAAEQPSFFPEESSAFSAVESSEISGLPCDPSNECPSVDCPSCCAVHILEVRPGGGCPTAPFTERDIIEYYYTPEQLAAICRGNGQYCDYYPNPLGVPGTTCDPITGNAILDFFVCCGCNKV